MLAFASPVATGFAKSKFPGSFLSVSSHTSNYPGVSFLSKGEVFTLRTGQAFGGPTQVGRHREVQTGGVVVTVSNTAAG